MTGGELMNGLLWAYEESYSPDNRRRMRRSRRRGLKKRIINQVVLAYFMKQYSQVKKYCMQPELTDFPPAPSLQHRW